MEKNPSGIYPENPSTFRPKYSKNQGLQPEILSFFEFSHKLAKTTIFKALFQALILGFGG
jgi:hypothetical protein